LSNQTPQGKGIYGEIKIMKKEKQRGKKKDQGKTRNDPKVGEETAGKKWPVKTGKEAGIAVDISQKGKRPIDESERKKHPRMP